jgi:glycosyltransferase involved in cell wall biosynthesis
MSVSIIIPIRNEEENIKKITRKISKLNIDLEICIIDDYSSDNSFKEALQIKKKLSFIKVAKNKKKGLGSAINTWAKFSQ